MNDDIIIFLIMNSNLKKVPSEIILPIIVKYEYTFIQKKYIYIYLLLCVKS